RIYQNNSCDMRAVIQRVSKAACRVGSEITGSIDEGLVVLLGIESTDNETDLEWLVQKLVNLRIFEDEKALMNRSIKEVGGDILLISQFTLFALTKKGNRPSFIRAARPETALPLYESAIAQLESLL